MTCMKREADLVCSWRELKLELELEHSEVGGLAGRSAGTDKPPPTPTLPAGGIKEAFPFSAFLIRPTYTRSTPVPPTEESAVRFDRSRPGNATILFCVLPTKYNSAG